MKKMMFEKYMNLAVVTEFLIVKLFIFKLFVVEFDATSLKMVYPIAACILDIEWNTLFHYTVLYIASNGTW
jgi:hypothetical protein